MEKRKNSRREFNSIVLENNILTILDNSWSINNPLHLLEDRAAFLKAVRDATLAPENGIPPTRKIYEAIFDILRNGESLELFVTSYQLLVELDKRYPRVCLSESSGSGSMARVGTEGWSPFVLSSDTGYRDRGGAVGNSSGSLDCAGFYQLVQDLAEMTDITGPAAFSIKYLGNMLLFQYLVSVLEGDFLPRNTMFKENMDWIIVKESALNLLLGSRKVNYKYIMTDCVSLACTLYSQVSKGFSDHPASSKNASEKLSLICNDGMAVVEVALLELGESTCLAIQKLLVVVMELDVSRKKADEEGYITRADGVRIPLMEIIMDQLTYDKYLLSPFLQVFSEPNKKLEIVLQYFWKYITKPSVRTRRSNNKSTDDTTFNGVLQCFSNIPSTKSIAKKIGPEVVQLLLAHAFQAHLSLEFESFAKKGMLGSPFKEICHKLTSVFQSLRKADDNLKILPFAKESLLTATRILAVDNK